LSELFCAVLCNTTVCNHMHNEQFLQMDCFSSRFCVFLCISALLLFDVSTSAIESIAWKDSSLK